jgi:predicted esterase
MRRRRSGMRLGGVLARTAILAALAFGMPGPLPAAAAAGAVLADLPRQIDPHAYYLVFLHGRIVEEKGPRPTDTRFGIYEYRSLLDAFAARGFTVISEQRPRGTDIGAYAAKVVRQVKALLAAGVPPRRVAVAGFSKGGAIALVAASALHHPEVRFVSLAGCGSWLFDHFRLDLAGPVLSLYDSADDLATSCASVLTSGRNPSKRREIVLHVGKGHGTFYRPDAAWLDPVTAWLAGTAAGTAGAR